MSEKTRCVQKKEMRKNEDRAERTRSVRVYTPNVDIIERKDNILLLADMPSGR